MSLLSSEMLHSIWDEKESKPIKVKMKRKLNNKKMSIFKNKIKKIDVG